MNPIGKAFLKSEVVFEFILLAIATLGIALHFTVEKDYLFFSVISFFFLGCIQVFSGFVQAATTWNEWHITYLIAVAAFMILYFMVFEKLIGNDFSIASYLIYIFIPFTYGFVFFLKNLDTIKSFREESIEADLV